jgi:hypothetical protein
MGASQAGGVVSVGPRSCRRGEFAPDVPALACLSPFGGRVLRDLDVAARTSDWMHTEVTAPRLRSGDLTAEQRLHALPGPSQPGTGRDGPGGAPETSACIRHRQP